MHLNNPTIICNASTHTALSSNANTIDSYAQFMLWWICFIDALTHFCVEKTLSSLEHIRTHSNVLSTGHQRCTAPANLPNRLFWNGFFFSKILARWAPNIFKYYVVRKCVHSTLSTNPVFAFECLSSLSLSCSLRLSFSISFVMLSHKNHITFRWQECLLTVLHHRLFHISFRSP